MLAFCTPGGHRSVMDGSIERKAEFDVPFQIVNDGAVAADLLHQGGMIGNLIGQDVPMSGGSF